MEKKDCLFQFATKHEIFADTGLITREEAEELWKKYQKELRENWDELSNPQMCIWINCDSETDYHTVGKEIDFRDCEFSNGKFYKVTRTEIV